MAALLWSKNDVVKLRLAFSRHFQTHCEWLAGGGASIGFFFRQVAIRIAARVHTFNRLGARPFGDTLLHVFVVALFFRCEIAIRFSFFEEPVRSGAMLRCVV